MHISGDRRQNPRHRGDVVRSHHEQVCATVELWSAPKKRVKPSCSVLAMRVPSYSKSPSPKRRREKKSHNYVMPSIIDNGRRRVQTCHQLLIREMCLLHIFSIAAETEPKTREQQKANNHITLHHSPHEKARMGAGTCILTAHLL